MRIVYVSTDPGVPPFGRKGASVHLQAIISQLLDRGHEVHLVTSRPGPVPGHLSGLHVHSLPAPHGSDTSARELAARAADRWTAVILDRLEVAGPVDLVYERYALWGRTAMAWARTHGVAAVLEVNSPLPDEQARHRALVDRDGATMVARSATADAGVVVCVSQSVADWVRSLGGADPTSVHVIPNGVDTRRFTPMEVRPGSPAFTIGFVGTLKPWHGVEDLVLATRLVRRHDPACRLLVVGDGPERQRLVELAARHGLSGAVEFTGAADPNDVPHHLARMDVAVAPYPPTEDFYFSPLKIYEYLAAGLAVVTSDVGTLPDLMGGPGQPIGVLYRAGSVVDLARTLLDLRHDPILRADLGRRGRRAMVDGHDWTHVLDRTLNLSEVHRGATQAS